MKRVNYYNLLGLTQNANKDQIKASFRHLAKKYHPDKNETKKDTESAFIIIYNAYKILIDEKTRKEYDIYINKIKNCNNTDIIYRRNNNSPIINKILSEFNYVLWDIDDILKKIKIKDLTKKINEKTLYDYILYFFNYIENELLNENYRFLTYINKKDKIKLHIENYFNLLRVEIDSFITKLEFKSDKESNNFNHLMKIKNEMIKFINNIYKKKIVE